MLFGEVLRVSLAALRADRLRSLLTMLGTTVLQVNPLQVHQAGVATTTIVKLTTQDAEMILDRSPNVVAVSPQQDRDLRVVGRNRNTKVQATGAKPNFLDVRAFQIESGRMFAAAHAEQLLGEQIRIAGRAFTVIGALKAKGATGFGDGDAQILIPFQTGRSDTFGTG
ncbi:MAG: ABC transporter permease [Gemmatimonadetes bacterium]|nr:ABC transporter permease [Gemmatimonadota bacterium]